MYACLLLNDTHKTIHAYYIEQEYVIINHVDCAVNMFRVCQVLPFRARVLKALAAPLDDRKRLVRTEAVAARGEWWGGHVFKSYLSTLLFFPGVSCISHPSPAPLPLGNSRNLYGPNLVIWIITSIFYFKVVQLPDLVWNASPHSIDTMHKFQTICDLNLVTHNSVAL